MGTDWSSSRAFIIETIMAVWNGCFSGQRACFGKIPSERSLIMTDACTNAPTHSRKPCCKRLSGQKETDQTSTHCINVWSNYGRSGETWTRGLMVPNHARYHLRYTPMQLFHYNDNAHGCQVSIFIFAEKYAKFVDSCFRKKCFFLLFSSWQHSGIPL